MDLTSSCYDFDNLYRSRRDNSAADALSRRKTLAAITLFKFDGMDGMDGWAEDIHKDEKL